jgi:TRAP-type C4-dicarboxylate transport system permease small subunit
MARPPTLNNGFTASPNLSDIDGPQQPGHFADDARRNLPVAGATPESGIPERSQFRLRDLPPEAWIAAPLLVLLVGFLTAQITLRFFFNVAVSWLEEVIRIVFVWSMYFSFLVAASDNRHIRVALHISALPKLAQQIAFTIADLIWIGFNLTIAYFGTTYVLSLFDYPYLSPTTGINLAWVYMIVPVGFALLTVRVLMNIVRLWRGDVLLRDSRLDN